MNQISPLSLPQFNELRDLLEDDFNDLIETYMQDSEKRVAEMQTALANDDNRLGFEAAHSLKGASSNLGAIRLTELCYQLQEIARGNQISKHAELVEEIATESQVVNTKIRELLAG